MRCEGAGRRGDAGGTGKQTELVVLGATTVSAMWPRVLSGYGTQWESRFFWTGPGFKFFFLDGPGFNFKANMSSLFFHPFSLSPFDLFLAYFS